MSIVTYFGADLAQPRFFSSMAFQVFSKCMKIFFIFGKSHALFNLKKRISSSTYKYPDFCFYINPLEKGRKNIYEAKGFFSNLLRIFYQKFQEDSPQPQLPEKIVSSATISCTSLKSIISRSPSEYFQCNTATRTGARLSTKTTAGSEISATTRLTAMCFARIVLRPELSTIFHLKRSFRIFTRFQIEKEFFLSRLSEDESLLSKKDRADASIIAQTVQKTQEYFPKRNI